MNNNSCSHSFVLASKINLFGSPNCYLFLLKNKDHTQARPMRHAPSRQKIKREPRRELNEAFDECLYNVYMFIVYTIFGDTYVSRNHISFYISENISHQNAIQDKKKKILLLVSPFLFTPSVSIIVL